MRFKHCKRNSLNDSSLWERFISEENFMNAVENACASSGFKNDRKQNEFRRIKANKEEYALKARQIVVNNPDYVMDDTKFFITRHKSKTREIHYPVLFPDHIIEWAIVNVIGKILFSGVEHGVGANYVGRGTDYVAKCAMKYFKKDMQRVHYAKEHNTGPIKLKYAFAYKDDLKKYFENIDLKLLAIKLKHKIKDQRMVKFIMQQYGNREKGVYIGRLLSQYIGSFYLLDFHQYINQMGFGKGYMNYMDDILFLGPNKSYLKKVREVAKKYLAEQGLELSKPNFIRVAEICPICNEYINQYDGKVKSKLTLTLRNVYVASEWDKFKQNLKEILKERNYEVIHFCGGGKKIYIYTTVNNKSFLNIIKTAIIKKFKEQDGLISTASMTMLDMKRVDMCGHLLSPFSHGMRKETKKKIISLLKRFRNGMFTDKDCLTFGSYWGILKNRDCRGKFWDKYMKGIDIEKLYIGILNASRKNNLKRLINLGIDKVDNFEELYTKFSMPITFADLKLANKQKIENVVERNVDRFNKFVDEKIKEVFKERQAAGKIPKKYTFEDYYNFIRMLSINRTYREMRYLKRRLDKKLDKKLHTFGRRNCSPKTKRK